MSAADSLAAIQRRFYALATGGFIVESQQGETGVSEGVADIDDVFLGSKALPASSRMQIYRNMYWIRLLDTLSEQFPDLYEALGRAGFGAAGRAYLEAHPPTSPSLRDLGRDLPGFLADRPELAAQAALAAVEWARIDLFDGPDVATLDAGDVQGLDPEALAELPLALAPTARLVGNVLVYRAGGHVQDRALEVDEASALAAVARGTTLGLLCDHVGDAATVFAFMSRWLPDEILLAPR